MSVDIPAGGYETHLTVAATTNVEALEGWAHDHGYKFGHIVLDRGETPSQPMLTRGGRGQLAEQVEIARGAARELGGDGFEVVRVKVEAKTSNDGVPVTDEDAHAGDPTLYFEHHVKVILQNEEQIPVLADAVKAHGARLSRNARRTRSDGCQERFITQRCYHMGRTSAKGELAALLKAIDGYEVAEIEEEYVLFDDNLSVDSGWLDAAPSR